MKKWLGIWKMDLYRCFANKRYWLIFILIPVIMMGCIHESILAQLKYNMVNPSSGPAKLMELLYFDRFKSIMVILLSGIYAFGISDDLQQQFMPTIMARGVTSFDYVTSKIAANTLAIVSASMGGFLFFLILISPLFPLEGREGFQSGVTGFYSVVETGDFPWMYGVLSGLQFGLAISFLTNISMMISIWVPSRYIAIAIPYVLFYILYAFTMVLPRQIDFWWLSSCWIVLQTDDFWLNFLYSNGILILGGCIATIGCLLSMDRRMRRAEV